jgi:hypothetical protein
MKTQVVILLSFIVGISCSTKSNEEEITTDRSNWDHLTELEFPEAYPTAHATEILYDEMLFQRATQSVLWSMPAMTLWYMKKGSEAQFGEGSNIFPIWKDRLNAKTLVSTPNSDVIYGMGYIDLKKDGPTVIEVPPLLQGILMTFGTDHLPMLVLLAQIKVKAENIYCFHPAMKGMSQMAILRLHLERIMCLFSGVPL